jgi:hypothetical protein
VTDRCEGSCDDLGADQVSTEVERHDHAHGAGADALRLPPDRQQYSLEAIPDL